MKKTLLAATVAAVAGLTLSGQAAASVYARSYLDISNFSVLLSDDGGVTPGGATIDSFTFQIDDRAQLNNGAVNAFGIGCAGVPGVPDGGVLTNDCGVNPALDIAAANAAGGDVTRNNNDFSFFGPGTDQFSNADAVIRDAQLTFDATTHWTQIAEAELQGGTQAASAAELQSNTGFTFAFTVAGANQLDIDFDSALDILTQINDPTGINQNAQANVNVEITLQNDNTGDFVFYRPDGDTTTGCVGTFGTCTELADDFDLNGDSGTSTDGTSGAGSRSGGGDHTMRLTGLFDGDWSFTINSTTSTSLARRTPLPEPSMLGLLGIGLAGMGAVRRRRKGRNA